MPIPDLRRQIPQMTPTAMRQHGRMTYRQSIVTLLKCPRAPRSTFAPGKPVSAAAASATDLTTTHTRLQQLERSLSLHRSRRLVRARSATTYHPLTSKSQESSGDVQRTALIASRRAHGRKYQHRLLDDCLSESFARAECHREWGRRAQGASGRCCGQPTRAPPVRPTG